MYDCLLKLRVCLFPVKNFTTDLVVLTCLKNRSTIYLAIKNNNQEFFMGDGDMTY